MKNNKGFSLIELIVVIAIIAVLVGASSVGISVLWGFYPKECANNLEAKLNKTRIDSMGKANMALELYQGSDGSYYADLVTYDSSGAVSSTTSEKIGRKSLTITYKDTTGATGTLGTDHIAVCYDRSSGALKANSSGKIYNEFTISQRSTTKTVTIYAETGKVTVD